MSKLDQLNIVPACMSHINHRSECLPYYDAMWSEEADAWSLAGAYLPIFTAPMSCVVDEKNYLQFDKEGIIPMIPRTVSFDIRLRLMHMSVWIAVGLNEFEEIINTQNPEDDIDFYICVDIANGHMKKLIDLCKHAKLLFGDKLHLMAGNVANPNTYYLYAEAGIDYIRCSIGSGGACRTDNLTGVGYSVDKLIPLLREAKECVRENINERGEIYYKSIPKIVIDGGMHSVRDIIIALALGADYVMCGKIFAQCEEGAGEIINKLVPQTVTTRYYFNDDCDGEFDEEELVDDEKVYIDSVQHVITSGRMYYGMSTERAQREMGNSKIKHSEGSETWVPIEYTLHDWVKQFEAAICSTMSYCNCLTLEQFIGNAYVVYK